MAFVAVPARSRLWLGRAGVPATLLAGPAPAPPDADGIVRVDIELRDGRISAIAPAGTAPAGDGVDLAGGMVWPAFVDVHTHLDKGHIWPRARNPNGSFLGAIEAVQADRALWAAEDVRRRMEFGLRCAYAHGTAAVRTHIDSYPGIAEISWAAFRALRDAWAGRVTLQAASITTLDQFGTPWATELADLIAESGGVLGAVTRLDGGDHDHVPPEFEAWLDTLFRLAEERGLDLDLHVDESGEQGAAALSHIARVAIRRRFKGRILCGHCCSLAVQPEPFVERTLALCAEAGIAVVSLPMCNLYLQDHAPGRTPRWRGVTLLHELRAQGVPVAVASDNCRDPFYAYGDHDALEVFTQAVRIAHLDTPFGDWPRAVTATPATIMGLADRGAIRIGAPADLVLLRGRDYSEILSRRQADRVVLRAGRAIDTALPDYRELDDLVAARSP